jgi:hypothetical protein
MQWFFHLTKTINRMIKVDEANKFVQPWYFMQRDVFFVLLIWAPWLSRLPHLVLLIQHPRAFVLTECGTWLISQRMQTIKRLKKKLAAQRTKETERFQ